MKIILTLLVSLTAIHSVHCYPNQEQQEQHQEYEDTPSPNYEEPQQPVEQVGYDERPEPNYERPKRRRTHSMPKIKIVPVPVTVRVPYTQYPEDEEKEDRPPRQQRLARSHDDEDEEAPANYAEPQRFVNSPRPYQRSTSNKKYSRSRFERQPVYDNDSEAVPVPRRRQRQQFRKTTTNYEPEEDNQYANVAENMHDMYENYGPPRRGRRGSSGNDGYGGGGWPGQRNNPSNDFQVINDRTPYVDRSLMDGFMSSNKFTSSLMGDADPDGHSGESADMFSTLGSSTSAAASALPSGFNFRNMMNPLSGFSGFFNRSPQNTRQSPSKRSTASDGDQDQEPEDDSNGGGCDESDTNHHPKFASPDAPLETTLTQTGSKSEKSSPVNKGMDITTLRST
ncbi:hypothetical protein HDE_03117 [Halotydeus destructor]|nr:hypothetical protein HDE_03117 [Halotydeus destructor]